MHVVADGETVEVETPFSVKVVVLKADLNGFSKTNENAMTSIGKWPLDKEVLSYLINRTK
jgi:hypothetical protein